MLCSAANQTVASQVYIVRCSHILIGDFRQVEEPSTNISESSTPNSGASSKSSPSLSLTMWTSAHWNEGKKKKKLVWVDVNGQISEEAFHFKGLPRIRNIPE